MESEIIFLIEETPDGDYTAKAVGYNIFTEADSINALKAMLKDAVNCHFNEKDRPKLIRMHTVRDEIIAV